MKFLVVVVVVLSCMMELPLKAESPFNTLDKDFLLAYSEKKIKEFSGCSEQEKKIFLQKHKYAIFLSLYGYYENIIRSVKHNKLDPSKNLARTYGSLANITEVITEHHGLGNVLLKNRSLTVDFFSFKKASTLSEIDIRELSNN
ncbi:MAG: hypothetical protein AB8G05_09215 [Oligoflexales bacterium]